MKELSIAGKATRYDQAIKVAKSKIKNDKDHVLYEDDVIEMFPELKESEDERIRKELISFFTERAKHTEDSTFNGLSSKEIIAWLEKQGKNNMGISEATKQKLEDNLNKTLEKETPESLNEFLDEQGEQKPADEIGNYDHGKVLESLMSAKMKTPEESLGIDSETYSEIIDECIYGEQEPAWSEEDELHIRELEGLVKRVWAIAEHENDKETIHKMSDLSFFLKTLKPQLKQEWSDEDNITLEEFISNWLHENNCDAFDKYGNVYVSMDNLRELVKSLIPQSQWKPSDEQMNNK